MKKPTLLILAAGLSSRYKLGLKQLDTFGPSGETLLDYAIYDALQAGFGQAIFVIRRNIKDDFEKQVTSKYIGKFNYSFVFQEIDDLPEGAKFNPQREKPWGTGHAVWAARNSINEPFAVINADDFYGREAYKTMAAFLSDKKSGTKGKYAMVGYSLGNTLSEYGSVSRGVCIVKDGCLQNIDERNNIRKQDGQLFYSDENDSLYKLDSNTVVSMNFWGFSTDLFSKFDQSFKDFIGKNGSDLESEFYLPLWIKEQIQAQRISVAVLHNSSKWVGVTYPGDKSAVIEKIRSWVKEGLYPTPLF